MPGRQIRLSKYFYSGCQLFDLSAPMLRGVSPKALDKESLLSFAGIIAYKGQVDKIFNSLLGRKSPRLLIRIDWTDLLGGKEKEEATHLQMCEIEEALSLGADGVVSLFLSGYSDEMEAKNFELINSSSSLSRKTGIPLIVDIYLNLKSIGEENALDALQLAMMMLEEAGVSALIIPYFDDFKIYEKMRPPKVPYIIRCPKEKIAGYGTVVESF